MNREKGSERFHIKIAEEKQTSSILSRLSVFYRSLSIMICHHDLIENRRLIDQHMITLFSSPNIMEINHIATFFCKKTTKISISELYAYPLDM